MTPGSPFVTRKRRRTRLEPRYWLKAALHALTGKELVRHRAYEHDPERLLKFLRDRGIGTLLDVGANSGQFAMQMRWLGYTGRIVSFEPLPDAHAVLTENAKDDPNWMVAERCALGAVRAVMTMNVAENSVSSSLLPISERHLRGAPKSRSIGEIETPVVLLDEILDRYVEANSGPLALKIDTQGYEGEVLKGARHSLARVALVHCEASLTKLYEGAPAFAALFREMEEFGYRCISIAPAFIDPSTFEVLQVDCTFAR